MAVNKHKTLTTMNQQEWRWQLCRMGIKEWYWWNKKWRSIERRRMEYIWKFSTIRTFYSEVLKCTRRISLKWFDRQCLDMLGIYNILTLLRPDFLNVGLTSLFTYPFLCLYEFIYVSGFPTFSVHWFFILNSFYLFF